MTEIVQRHARHANVDLLYASLPTERLRTAPPARVGVAGMAEPLLTVRMPFEERDLVAQREEYACHRTRYGLASAVERDAARFGDFQAIGAIGARRAVVQSGERHERPGKLPLRYWRTSRLFVA